MLENCAFKLANAKFRFRKRAPKSPSVLNTFIVPKSDRFPKGLFFFVILKLDRFPKCFEGFFFATVSVKNMLMFSLFPNRIDFPKAYSFCFSQIGSIPLSFFPTFQSIQGALEFQNAQRLSSQKVIAFISSQ